MKKIILLLLLLPLLASAENYTVTCRIANLPENSQPKLLRIFNGNMYVLDSIPVMQDSLITFSIPEKTAPGMFRAILGISPYARFMNGQATSLDFLFNKEDIRFTFDFNNPDGTMEVSGSPENSIYFDFQKKDQKLFQKLGSLEQVVTQYPDKDDFYRLALKYYKLFQVQRSELIDSIYQSNPDMLAAKIINTRRMPFSEGDILPAVRDSIFKAQFLDNIEFTDTTLLYTNIYTDKLFQYINFFINREAGPRENEAIIIKTLDEIMPKISANEQIRTTLLQFLISGFESMKMEEVLAHISANYLQQCGSSMELIKRRLEGYKKMAVGEKVPDFVVADIDNNPINLYENISPYTLLIFWHTGCGHCKALLNEIPKMIGEGLFQKHNVNIICISIDEEREDWITYSQTNHPTWTNTFAEGAFTSQVATDYNLFATPSMFIVDSDHKIVAKPITPEELVKDLENLK